MPMQNVPPNDGGAAITANSPLIRRDQDGTPIFYVDHKGNVSRKGRIDKIR